jgi:hypothetical protein
MREYVGDFSATILGVSLGINVGEAMKALSIRQPWAWLIVNGHKDVENRDWVTKFRGPLLIHAGLKFDHDGLEWVRKKFPKILLPGDPETFSRDDWDLGGIIGKAEVTDCVDKSKSRWFSGTYGFVLANARKLPFVPMKGKLGFFEVEDELIRKKKTAP